MDQIESSDELAGNEPTELSEAKVAVFARPPRFEADDSSNFDDSPKFEFLFSSNLGHLSESLNLESLPVSLPLPLFD